MTRLDATTLADLLHGTDVLVFAAEAARASGEGGTAGTTTIEAARRAGVHRLLLVSVFPEAWRGRDRTWRTRSGRRCGRCCRCLAGWLAG
ncbi:hypothetical protein ACH41E_06375 [Streptomyces sp. NPDC020412]|uniref:hypothetical protein n=1 Tax=Streptomyces sp. NPDC020412 TaxID=3365073 RepID=UPI00379A1736